MNRDDFRRLAETRLEDAKVLLVAGRFGAAYYFAGYSVECALKACICRKTLEFDFPVKDASKYYQHNLVKLAEFGVGSALDADCERDPGLRAYWNVARDWNEQSRYEDIGPETERTARNLVEAISDRQHGVLQWLSKYW